MSARPRHRGKRTADDVPADGSVRVSSLRPCRDDPSRVSVRVDGVLMGRLDRETCTDAGLESGVPWTHTLDERLGPLLARSRVLRGATRLLAARDRSSAELARALSRRGHTRDQIDWAIERLRERGVLDDASYAARRARSLAASKPMGRRYMESKLRQRGLGDAEIRPAVEEALEGVDMEESALRLARRAAASMPNSLEHASRIRRLSGRLARRGFEPDLVRRVVDEVLGETPD